VHGELDVQITGLAYELPEIREIGRPANLRCSNSRDGDQSRFYARVEERGLNLETPNY